MLQGMQKIGLNKIVYKYSSVFQVSQAIEVVLQQFLLWKLVGQTEKTFRLHIFSLFISWHVSWKHKQESRKAMTCSHKFLHWNRMLGHTLFITAANELQSRKALSVCCLGWPRVVLEETGLSQPWEMPKLPPQESQLNWDVTLPRLHSPLTLNSAQSTQSYSCNHPGRWEVTYNFETSAITEVDGKNSSNSGTWEVRLLRAISSAVVSVSLTNPCAAQTWSYNTSNYSDVLVGNLCLLTLIAELSASKKLHSCLGIQQAAHTSASTQ